MPLHRSTVVIQEGLGSTRPSRLAARHVSVRQSGSIAGDGKSELGMDLFVRFGDGGVAATRPVGCQIAKANSELPDHRLAGRQCVHKQVQMNPTYLSGPQFQLCEFSAIPILSGDQKRIVVDNDAWSVSGTML